MPVRVPAPGFLPAGARTASSSSCTLASRSARVSTRSRWSTWPASTCTSQEPHKAFLAVAAHVDVGRAQGRQHGLVGRARWTTRPESRSSTSKACSLRRIELAVAVRRNARCAGRRQARRHRQLRSASQHAAPGRRHRSACPASGWASSAGKSLRRPSSLGIDMQALAMQRASSSSKAMLRCGCGRCNAARSRCRAPGPGAPCAHRRDADAAGDEDQPSMPIRPSGNGCAARGS